MAAPGEVTTLLLGVVLEVSVAIWWWRGRAPRRSRAWVAGLLLANASVTLVTAFAVLSARDSAYDIARVIDRASDVFLLGVALLSFGNVSRRVFFASVGIGAACVAVSTAEIYEALRVAVPPIFVVLQEVPLIASIFIVAAGIARRARAPLDRPEERAWMMVLGALGMRFAELSAHFLHIALYDQPFEGDTLGGGWAGLRLLAGAAMMFAFATLLASLRRRSGRPLRVEVSLLLFAGFALGTARFGLIGTATRAATAIFFTLAIVRPLLFTTALVEIESVPFWDSVRARAFIAVAVGGAIGIAGGAAGGTAWGLGTAPIVLASLAIGMLSAAFLLRILSVPHSNRELLERPAPSATSSAVGQSAPDMRWSVDAARVPLPQNWESCLNDMYKEYGALPADVQAKLAALSRWQRLILALDGVHDDSPLPAYRRTTPGLHLVTQSPYSAIGPEMARANARARTILHELGINVGTRPLDGRQPLIASSWGKAEELKSPRVSIYSLTSLGSEVAARLRERVGIGDPAAASRVIGEDFRPLPPIQR